MAEEARPRRRGLLVLGAATLLVAGGVGATVLALGGGDSHAKDADAKPGHTVVEVSRQTLTVGASLSGTLGFGSPSPLPVRATGTVTWLPRSGATIARGGVLLRVDDRPVVLMLGRTPAYRALHDTATTQLSQTAPEEELAPPAPLTGPDVRQLEANLVALGYSGLIADDTFTSGTASAVKAWQRDLGVDPTGRVEFGDVLFLGDRIRVVTDPSVLGQEVTPEAVQRTPTAMTATVSAPPEAVEWAVPGAAATVLLPDQRTVAAKVVAVRPDTGGEGSVVVQLALVRHEGRAEPGPVTVTYVSRRADDVLAVPVTALVALAEGGYGVQLASGEFVPVTPGLYSDGKVEVTGDLAAGTRVRVPQ